MLSIVSASLASDSLVMKFQQPMPVLKESGVYDELIRSINRAYQPPPSTATRYYFVRHGESTGNKERIYTGQTLDVDLTEQGVSDAMRAAEALKEMQRADGWVFDAIFSSPSLRAKRTTEIALAQLLIESPPFTTDVRLMEKHNGAFDGKPMDAAYRARIKQFESEIGNYLSFWDKMNYKHDPHDAKEESVRHVFDRLHAFMQEKNADQNFHGKHVFVGSHGGVLRTLFMVHTALNHDLIIEPHRLEVPNGSLVVIDVDQGSLRIVRADGFKFRT